MAHQRYYQLQLKSTCSLKCSFCPGLGLVSEKEKIYHDLIQSLRKARSGNYSAALIPCNVFEWDDLEIIIETIKSHGLEAIVQINSRQLQNKMTRIEEVLGWSVGVQIIWGNNISISDSIFSKITQKALSFHITIVAHKRMHALETFRSLPESIKAKAYFYFPYQQDNTDEFFTPENVYEFLKRFRVQFPGYRAQPTPGVDIYDHRKKKHQELEPVVRPYYKTASCDSPVLETLYSVIITTRNDEHHIELLLQSLEFQTLAHEQFEVVIVDEGSSDATLQKIITYAKSASDQFRLKLIRQPRFAVATNETSEHRTAVSQNLGVKMSRGEHLFFLDAQSFVPQSLLTDLLLEHKDWDLIQTRRLILPADIDNISPQSIQQKELEPFAEPENPFWRQFYQNSDGWNQMTDGWRYLSSKNLSLRRDVFEFVGWYRKTFFYHGFEDSDLGYRAKKKGFNYHLSQQAVFQKSSTKKDVPSFFKRGQDKQVSLSKMAKVFFQNNLDTDIYESLRSYM